jgi:hypothetical protein
MRHSILAVLAVAAAVLPKVASADSEWAHVIGGKLTSSGPPFNFSPRRVNILITELPASWPARAGQCRTLTHEGAPKIRFDFNDGSTTGTKLVASGYRLDGDKAGHPFLVGRTYITLCRSAAGKPTAFKIQLSYYKVTASNVVQGYVVYAENNAARGGKSSVYEGGLFSGTAASGATASSNAVNTLVVWP